MRGTNPSEKHQNTRGGGARCARGEMHALAHKLPAELVDLILQHAAAMTLQGGARCCLARRTAARARREREREVRDRERAFVDRFLGSFAFGSDPLPNALSGWEGDRRWFERYRPRKMRRLAAIGGV